MYKSQLPINRPCNLQEITIIVLVHVFYSALPSLTAHSITSWSCNDVHTMGVDEGFDIYPVLESSNHEQYEHFIEEIFQNTQVLSTS